METETVFRNTERKDWQGLSQTEGLFIFKVAQRGRPHISRVTSTANPIPKDFSKWATTLPTYLDFPNITKKSLYTHSIDIKFAKNFGIGQSGQKCQIKPSKVKMCQWHGPIPSQRIPLNTPNVLLEISDFFHFNLGFLSPFLYQTPSPTLILTAISTKGVWATI